MPFLNCVLHHFLRLQRRPSPKQMMHIERSNGLDKGPRTVEVIYSYLSPPNVWRQELMMMMMIMMKCAKVLTQTSMGNCLDVCSIFNSFKQDALFTIEIIPDYNFFHLSPFLLYTSQKLLQQNNRGL